MYAAQAMMDDLAAACDARYRELAKDPNGHALLRLVGAAAPAAPAALSDGLAAGSAAAGWAGDGPGEWDWLVPVMGAEVTRQDDPKARRCPLRRARALSRAHEHAVKHVCTLEARARA